MGTEVIRFTDKQTNGRKFALVESQGKLSLSSRKVEQPNGRDAVAKHVDEWDVAKRDTPTKKYTGVPTEISARLLQR